MPDANEGLLEGLADLVALELALAGDREAEVVDPDERAVSERELVRALVGHLHAQVLEHREHVAEREHAA